MDRLGHKMVALSVIFVTIFVMTALPIKVADFFYRQGQKGRVVLSCIMCFGGGVFFGTYLLHMSPEVNELIEKVINKPNHIHYPVSFLIIGVGFLLMMLIEKAVIELQKWKEQRQKLRKLAAENNLDNGIEGTQANTVTANGYKSNAAFVHSNATIISKGQDLENLAMSNVQGNGEVVQNHHEHYDHEVVQNHHEHHDHYGHGGQGHGHSHEGHSHLQGSSAKSIVLLLALSVDCVFEGLTLGLQTTVGGVWNMVLAILSHEVVVAFSLGLQLFKNNSPKKTFLMALIYGITCPVGIAIGTGLKEGAGEKMNIDLLHGILLGISAGVFIHVAFFEILFHEISHDTKLINLIAIVVGFGLMAGLVTFHTHCHDDDHDHDHTGNGTHVHSYNLG